MREGFAGFALKFFFCVVAALLNSIIPTIFMGITPNPLVYLDTVLIITITFMWGLKWGIISAAVSSVLTPAVSILFFGGIWQQYLFIPCFFATAFVTYLFMRLFPAELNLADASIRTSNQTRRRNNAFDKVMATMIALIIMAFALCIVISILGGCISTLIIFLDNSMAASGNITPEATVPLLVPGMPLLVREILSRIPINIIDRLISAFVGYGAARSITALIGLFK
jgi:hypothetical protein